MSRSSLSHRALAGAAVFAFVQTASVQTASRAHAQTVDLRDLDRVDGFPSSPADAPIVSPEDNSSPSTGLSQTPESGAQQGGAPTEEQPDDGAPNYGKARMHPPKLYKPDPKTSPPLTKPPAPRRPNPRGNPQSRTAEAAEQRVDPTYLPPPAVTLGSLLSGQPVPFRSGRPSLESDPFVPTGVQVGEFVMRPFVETSSGYETNPNQVATGVKPSSVLRVDGGLGLASDFSSGSLTADVGGGYSDFPSNTNANRPNLSAIVDGRVDVTRIDTIDTEARFGLSTQTPGSPLLAVPNSVYITNRPTVQSEGATLGGTHLFGRLAVSLKGTFDRFEYGDATQSDGSILQYSQNNLNDYGVVARAAYELTPSIIPFTELGFDTRVRDNAVDLAGYDRNSIGGTARAGATVDLLGYLSGNASVGYLDRHYDDPRLPNLRGPSVDGALIFAATPITSLTLRAGTVASETTLAGASGAISRNFGVELAHVFFRAFTVSGIATLTNNDYQGLSGSENYTTFTLKGAYSVTRDVQLIASASHQSLASTFSAPFHDEVFLVGVKLQR